MPYLKYISATRLLELSAEIKNNIAVYVAGNTSSIISSDKVREARIEVGNPPELIVDGVCLEDYEASKLIYSWLDKLSIPQANDEKLWVFLSHVQFERYSNIRWGRDNISEDTIKERWFYKGIGNATKLHNSISRLWWFSHLIKSVDVVNYDRNLKLLLSLQQIQVDLLERNIGRCKPLVKAFFNSLHKNIDKIKDSGDAGGKISRWIKLINRQGGVYFYDLLPEERMSSVFERIIKDIIDSNYKKSDFVNKKIKRPSKKKNIKKKLSSVKRKK
jgi:Family of unknown function (DUF6339)